MRLNYGPHEGQQLFHNCRKWRFRALCTGRRWGKTLCLAAEVMNRAGEEVAGDYAWVAPTYNVADRGIEACREIATEVVEVMGRAPARIEVPGPGGQKSRIWFLSADNPDSIRGFGFQGLVIDEAASMSVDVWNYVLRPTISQTLGWAVLCSTPKGRNWFYDMFTRGQDPNESDYASFRFASKDSPFFPQAEWEEAKRTLPEDVFRQEYMAEFLEDSAGVFRGIDGCVMPDTGSSTPGDYHRSVVIGCDLAKHTDWTVLVAMDAETGQCFAMERFNQLEWPIQKERIVAFARKWRGRVILDATGVGDPVYDDLKRVLPDIEAFVITPGSKVELVQRLVVAIEQRQISWPVGSRQWAVDPESDSRRGAGAQRAGFGPGTGEWDTLTAELKRYEYAIGSTGKITYGAPSGYHDDCVMALALANHGRWERGTVGTMARLCVGEPRWGWRPRRGGFGRGRERASQGV